MFYPVFAGSTAQKSKPDAKASSVRKWFRSGRPRLRQIHTKMSGTYFHRGISRLKAEELLLNAGEDGSFLVRDSETLTGAYVLCLLYQSRVHQYRVLPGADNNLSIQAEGGAPEPKYADLNSLVADYMKRGEKNGLAFSLRFPVAPERGEEPDSDEEEYQETPTNLTPPVLPDITNGLDQDTEEQKIKATLLKNFSKLDKSSIDSDVMEALKTYFEKGIETDVTVVKSGETNLPEFQKLMEFTAKGLQKELDKFLRNVKMIHELLSVPEASSSRLSTVIDKSNGCGIPAMLEKMSKCRNNIMALDNKVQETLRYFSVSLYDSVPVTGSETLPESFTPLLSTLGKSYIPRSDFEVKLIRTGKQSRMTLSIDIQHGKLYAVKPSKDVLDPNSVFTHSRSKSIMGQGKYVPSKDGLDPNSVFTHCRIIQLVKSTKDNTRLDMFLSDEDKKKKHTKYTMTFQSVHVRETFCQQIMQMKNMHSTQVDVDQISIFVGTWNMGDSQPTASINSWLRCNGSGKSRDPQVLGVIPHDMYVIGTQESAMTEKDWVNFVKNHIKSCLMADVELVEVCTLWGIRVVVLVKKQLQQYINRIQHSTVRTGIANTLGNKGAVAISFYFKGTSFCFINSHLTSGDERNERRNQNYRDIIRGLSLGQKHLGLFDITNQFNHLFWLGDLNYRIEDNIATILEKLEARELDYLLTKDQLKKSQREKKGFCGFSEEDISFMPTYRLPRFQMEYKYDWRKVKKTGERINAPSWCDRVLWRSYPGTYIENLAYGCADKVLGSDHRPVFASFNIGVTSDFVMNRNSLVDECIVKLVFNDVIAQVKTCCKQYFYLEFHSTCLGDIYQSKPNTSFQQHKTGFYTCPIWEKRQIPELKPLFGDEEYLNDQHILIAVRSRDGDNESYGECVVALKGKIEKNPQEFDCQLLHQGEVTGKLTGQFNALMGTFSGGTSRTNSKKSYEIVALDTEYIDPELMHSDVPPGSDTRHETHSQIVSSNSHPILTHVQSSPGSLLDRPQLPVPRSALDDIQGSGRLQSQPHMGQASIQAIQRQVLPVTTTPSGPTISEPPSKPPPPVPKKQPSYVNVSKYPASSKSIVDWLQSLLLDKYKNNFLDNGYDSISFVSNMKREDLIQIGIKNVVHQEIILNSIKSLGN